MPKNQQRKINKCRLPGTSRTDVSVLFTPEDIHTAAIIRFRTSVHFLASSFKDANHHVLRDFPFSRWHFSVATRGLLFVIGCPAFVISVTLKNKTEERNQADTKFTLV